MEDRVIWTTLIADSEKVDRVVAVTIKDDPNKVTSSTLAYRYWPVLKFFSKNKSPQSNWDSRCNLRSPLLGRSFQGFRRLASHLERPPNSIGKGSFKLFLRMRRSSFFLFDFLMTDKSIFSTRKGQGTSNVSDVTVANVKVIEWAEIFGYSRPVVTITSEIGKQILTLHLFFN